MWLPPEVSIHLQIFLFRSSFPLHMVCSHLSFINLSLSFTPSLSPAESESPSPKKKEKKISAVHWSILQLCCCLPLLTFHSPSFLLCLSKWRGKVLFPSFYLSSHLPSVLLCPSLFALCLLVSAENSVLSSSVPLSLLFFCQSRRAASSQMLLSSLLRCMCSLSSLPLAPSLCWSFALWPAEWFAPQLPAVTICPFNAWSADVRFLSSLLIHPSLPPSSLPPAIPLCLSSCCLSSLFNHLLLSLLLPSQRRQAPPTGGQEARSEQQEISFKLHTNGSKKPTVGIW